MTFDIVRYDTSIHCCVHSQSLTGFIDQISVNLKCKKAPKYAEAHDHDLRLGQNRHCVENHHFLWHKNMCSRLIFQNLPSKVQAVLSKLVTKHGLWESHLITQSTG